MSETVSEPETVPAGGRRTEQDPVAAPPPAPPPAPGPAAGPAAAVAATAAAVVATAAAAVRPDDWTRLTEITALTQGRPDNDPGAHPDPVTRTPALPRTSWGHRGYDPEPVDSFITVLQQRLAEGRGEIEDLRRELDRLHRYIRREWSTAGRNPPSTPGSGAMALAQAEDVAQERLAEADRRLIEARSLALRRVEDAGDRAATLLAEAQQRSLMMIEDAESQAAQRLAAAESMAEQTLARAWKEAAQSKSRAEQVARTTLSTIQLRYQEIVVRAHQRAEQAASNALHELEQHAGASDDAGEARAELKLRAAYLHSSAEVSRAAMRAALGFAQREFDRLLGVEDETPTASVSLIDLPT